MLRVIYLYDVVPGRAAEAREWARKKWIPFWTTQPRVKGYEVYTNFFGPQGGVPIGSPQRMVSFDIEDISSLDSILTSPLFGELAKELQQYAINVQFVIFRKSFPEDPC